MFGEDRKLITLRCVNCGKWTALRVDKDDLDRHLHHGIPVQHAFVDRNGKPYLSPSERELFLSKCCPDCWSLLCPSDPMAYC
jgi:hypothetical protein